MKRLMILTLLAAVASSCAIINFPLSLPRAVEMREFVVTPPKHRLVRHKIVLLDISGVITTEERSGLFGQQSSTLADVRDVLDKAEKDGRIKALILRIDSPGGEVTASDIIYEQIRRFKQQRRKNDQPVVVIASLLGQGTSGGYYVALAADKIYAHPTTLTGAIGVIAVFPKLAGLTRKLGVDVRVIKSADKKDIGSLWRDFTAEEQKILQQTIDEMFERFVQIVTENRPQLDRETTLRLADGRMYTAQQALDLRLVDGIAYLDEVIEKAKSLAGIRDAAVVTYQRTSQFEGGIYSHAPTAPPTAAEVSLFRIDGGGLFAPWRMPGFYYLWMP